VRNSGAMHCTEGGWHIEGRDGLSTLEKSGTRRFESYYVREGMTIHRLNSQTENLRGRGSFGVMVEPGRLASAA